MSSPAPAPTGYADSLRLLGESLLASLQDRIQLFTLELQEEKFRLIQIFIWISSAIFAAMMVVTFATLTVVYLFWETARLAALGGLTALYAIALLAIIVGFRRFIDRQPKPFAGTLQEIGEDRACMQTAN